MFNDPEILANDTQLTRLQTHVQAELSDYSPKENINEELKKLRSEFAVIQERVGQIENNLNALAGNYQAPVKTPTIEKANLMIGPVARKKNNTPSPSLEGASDTSCVKDALQEAVESLASINKNNGEESGLNESEVNEFFGANYSEKRLNHAGNESDVASLKKTAGGKTAERGS